MGVVPWSYSLVYYLCCFLLPAKVSSNFNVLMDREEVHKLLGLSSDIYLVREGVVNDYALNFVVNVPSHIDNLNFKWQSLTKKPVHYEMIIEFADFFALLLPSSNISNVGRLPAKLETFTVSLPCSGQTTTEVPVTIKFIFNVKQNLTEIAAKRNKICLKKDTPLLPKKLKKSHSTPKDNNIIEVPSLGTNHDNHEDSLYPRSSPTPSLLLGGLLGACLVIASLVSIGFFVCLRRRLKKQDSDSSVPSSYSDGSPACLLRYPHLPSTAGRNPSSSFIVQSTPPTTTWLTPSDLVQTDKSSSSASIAINPFCTTRDNMMAANNSYVSTSNAFWSELSSNKSPGHIIKGSDVSPYAYARVVCHPPPPAPALPPPVIAEWYSPCPSSKNEGHVYANQMQTFGSGCGGSSSSAAGGDERGRKVDTLTTNTTGNSSSTLGSIVQIDGFQCRKKLIRDKGVEERFL